VRLRPLQREVPNMTSSLRWSWRRVPTGLPGWARWPNLGDFWSAGREFFRHHGIWAPGVRLHRRLDFRAKAAIVASVFVLPSLLLAGLQLRQAWQEHADLRRCAQLLHWAQKGGELADAVGHQRLLLYRSSVQAGPAVAESEWRDLLQRSDAAWARLKSAQPSGPLGPALQARWVSVQEHWLLLTGPRVGSTREQMQLRSRFLAAMTDLMESLPADEALRSERGAELRMQQRLALVELLRLSEQLALSTGRVRMFATAGDRSLQAHAPVAAAAQSLREQVQRSRMAMDLVEAAAAPGADRPGEGAGLRSLLQQMLQRQDRLDRLVFSGATAQEVAQELDGVPQLMQQLSLLRRGLTDRLDAHWQARVHAQQRNFVLACAALCLTLLLAVYLLYAFFHVLRGGMAQIQREVRHMAEGNLSRRPRPLGRDEAALTLGLLTESLGNLGNLFAVVKRGVASVAHASTEIATASSDLSRGSAQAASSVEAVREGIGAMVDHLDGYEQCVQQAVERARAMRTESSRSRRVMGTLAERISGLQQRSREIGKIVTLIDGIAFQTHLLSLNASVEAARAGEAGKGFSVVAHEVRQLSHRVAGAAQQIADIVAASISEVEQGRAITQRTVEAVVSTESEVHGVNGVLQRLSELTREGQRNVKDMAGSLDELHRFSENNARLSEQMSSAAREMQRESLQVSEQSSRFKLA
jgi:methyl-accepting chemotaxis protein